AVEFISPVLTSINQDWIIQLEKFWSTLLTRFDISPHISCATHVHVGRKGAEFSTQDLKAIWKGILYYNDVINFFGFLKTQWAKRNTAAPSISAIRQRRYGRVDDIPDLVADGEIDLLFDFVDRFQTESALAKAASPDREYCWNFQPILDDRKTIEFRMPTGSRNARESIAWIARANAFILLCCRKDWTSQNLGRRVRSSTQRSQSTVPLWNELCDDLRAAAKLLGLEQYLSLPPFMVVV
ncbi:MAG: hypothetical protein Q9191_008461, partial [Dirinaria sp. TL-2023a]